MTPRKHREKLERELGQIALRYSDIIADAARAAIARSNGRLTAFVAAMGSSSFYGRRGEPLIWREDLPKYARDVLELCDAYEESLGSPGIQI